MKRVSKYVNQIKRVNEIVFSSVEYKKGKLRVVAEGYTGEIWIGTQTWKNYDDNSTTTKRSSLHGESKRFKEIFTKIVEDVLCGFEDDLKVFRKYIAKMFCEVSEKGEKALKVKYREMSQKYHPDVCKHENAHELMKIINTVYHGIEFAKDTVDEMTLVPLDIVVSHNSEESTDELRDLKNICDVRELKKEYRRLARKFHPDNLDTGNTEQFKLVKTIFEVRTKAIESALEIFNMFEDTFLESFDGWKGYTEEKIKEELNESKDECFKDFVDNEEQYFKGIYNIQY